MKILFLINNFGGGGRERRMIQLLKDLSGNPDFEMQTITFSDRIDYKEVLNVKMVKHCIHFQDRKQRCDAIEDIIRSFKPDIVHSWIDTPTEMMLLGLLKGKYNYKYIAGFVADANKDKKTSFRYLAMRYTFMKADAVISNSRAGLIAKGAPMKKSHVIYNGFNFDRIPESVNKAALREELSVTTKYLSIMFARVNDAKDWDSYINLADMSRDQDVTFLAIGNGEKLEYYQEKINGKYSNIRFVGRRTDIESILQLTDFSFLFTNSSKHAEGVSNSILESMASGVPVIATEGGGTGEIITDGKDGHIIKPSDVQQAYKDMLVLMQDSDLYNRTSENARNKIHSQFSIDKMTKTYMDIYHALIN